MSYLSQQVKFTMIRPVIYWRLDKLPKV